MKRMTLVKIHLYCSGIALVFMGLMAFSGSMHLLVGDEGEDVSEVKRFSTQETFNKDSLTELFEKELSAIDSGYRYSYIKGSETSQISRPTTRTYYSIKANQGEIIIEKHKPSILKTLMEFHKGHSARASRPIQGVLGIVVLIAVLSGLWLGWSAPGLRKTTVATIVSGAILYLILILA